MTEKTIIALRQCTDETCNHVDIIGEINITSPISYEVEAIKPGFLRYVAGQLRQQQEGKDYDTDLRFWVHEVKKCSQCQGRLLRFSIGRK